jgi:hypothetical protein
MGRKRQLGPASEPVNVSQAIRDYKAANPEAKAKTIAAGLTEQLGQEVRTQQVYTALSNAGLSAGKKRKTGMKRIASPARSNGQASNGHAATSRATINGEAHPFEALLSLKELSGRFGGLEQTARALSVLEQLTKA